MSQNDTSYALNFVLPAGATGERGPQGPQGPQGSQGPIGPTGPTFVKAIASLNYNNTTSGDATIYNNMVAPSNSNIFRINSNSIVLNERGMYEFIIYGLLKDSSSKGASVVVKVGASHLISVILDTGTYEIYFSRSNFTECNAGDTITVRVNRNTSSSAVAESMYLIIKKFAF